MRTLTVIAACGLAILAVIPARAAEPRRLADDVIGAVLVDNGTRVLAYDGSLQFSLIDIATGRAEPWQMGWQPTEAGFHVSPDAAYPNLAARADGSLVALAHYVTFAATDPAQDYPNTAYLLLLCRPDGSTRPAALVEPTDGGPHLDFSQDGRYLIGPWFYDCAPSIAGYEEWYASLNQTMEITDNKVYTNALDVETGQLVALASLADTEWGVNKSPYSDWYAYEDMDTPMWHFGCLSGPEAGLTGSWEPEQGTEYVQNNSWVGPELLLLWRSAGQLLVDVHGTAWPAPAGKWVSYCLLPDGRSFFSRDSGASIELGRIDWRTGAVTDGRACPELAHFAVPYDPENGWPERFDTWMPLPDSSGAVVHTPGIDDGGGLYFVAAD
jgi:hypothetical protein